MVSISREALGVVLENAKVLHPREAILLLRGKVGKDAILISEVLVPPMARYGRGFASFPVHMMPTDFSIIGTAHSHPSGNLRPSIEDLNRSLGRIIMIVAFPYLEGNVAVYNRAGKRQVLRVSHVR
ncbi:MAG: Mov34/MPN/PAD-1 family protein [Candidatus Bathyarchaeia archaeon]